MGDTLNPSVLKFAIFNLQFSLFKSSSPIPSSLRPRSSILGRATGMSLKIRLLFLATFVLLTGRGPIDAAEEITDRPAAEFFLQDGRVITAPGEVLEKASVLIRRGRIIAVGTDLMPPASAEIVPCAGLTIVAGFLDAGNTALLDPDVKLPSVDARPIDVARQPLVSVPADDHRALTPQFEAATAFRGSDKDLEPYRQSGFGAVHLTPTGRIASGQTSIVMLAGRPVRESQLSFTPRSVFRLYERRSNDYPSTLMGVHAHLRQHFFDTKRWVQQKQMHHEGVPGVDRPENDPVWEALAKVQQGEQITLFEVDSPDDFERALRFADEQKLKLALWSGGPPRRSLDVLKQRTIPVMVSVDFGDAPKTDAPKADKNKADDEYAEVAEPQAVRDQKKQRWQERVRVLAEYEKAGIPFAISTAGLKNPNDLFKALREAIKEGLSRDGALAALTTRPAGMLGVDRDLGRIAPGLLANVVVMTGPLDHDQTKVRFNFIEGRKFEFHRDAKPVPAESTPAAAPLSVAGTWHLQIEAGDMPSQATLELTQNGARLSGRMTSSQGDGLITSGEATKDSAKWEVSIGTGDRSLVLKFDATHAADVLSGTVKSAFGAPAKWTAKKAAAGTPKETAAENVQLSGIDTGDEPKPVSALHPMSTAIATVEFPEDRTARKLKTGGNVLIKNATVITVTGPTLEKHSILVRGGKIAAIGPDLMPDEGMTVIDAAGRFVMPGIIDTHSHIMMSNGLGGVNEYTHSIVCEVRVNDITNTADPQEYRALAGGVTTIRQLHGSANVIGGQDAVVQLKIGESAAAHQWPGGSNGVKFALGENVKFRSGRFPNTRLGVEATLQRAFIEALEYRKDWQEYDRAVKQAGGKLDTLLPPRQDLRLEALAQILNGEKLIHSHCYRSDEILMLLRVAEHHGIRVRSLQHVLEGYKVAPEIVAHGASCSTFADWWAYKVEAFDATPYNAELLREAGANIVLKSDDAELMRHMYQEAQKPIRYGNFPADLALALVTINPAKELGLADVVGSIEVGKQADLAIFNGHPLNTFARCEMTLIAGEPYFVRADKPSAMTAEAAQCSPSPLTLPRADERKPLVDWSAIQGPRFALVGAAIHLVDRAAIGRGTVVVENGKIAAVTEGEDIPEGCPVIRVEGLQIYPGLFDAGTTVGLTEIGKVTETHDFAEAGLFQPDLRAGVAINPDSELIPVARAGGITTALIFPISGIISGQASVMHTAGWTAPEMVHVDSAGMRINWPGARETRDVFEQLKQWIAAAKRYDAVRADAKDGVVSDVPIDPRYEALRPYVRGEKPFHIEADSQQHLTEALQFAEKEKLKIVLCNAADAWKMTDALKKADTPVIIGPVMRKPLHDHDPFDAPYANAGRLHDAGVKFAIRSNNAANSRNAPFEAGMAVAYGLPEDAGLRSVTLAAAEILGVADQCGSITVGKRADLVILDGSPLQVTSQVKGVVVGGKPFAPVSRQTMLYEKYRERLKEVRAAK